MELKWFLLKKTIDFTLFFPDNHLPLVEETPLYIKSDSSVSRSPFY